MTGERGADDPVETHDARELRVGVAVAVGAVVAAVVAAAARAVVDGWYPVGDNAYFALRSQDVFTEHHPLLGTWTSASLTVGFDFNNPAPLLFDVLAVGAKIDPTLVPLGVALLVLGSIATLAACASRVAGRRGVVAAMFASAGLAWALGPELIIDPWQPHSLLFPFLALIGVTVATCAGSDGSLLAVTAFGSLVVGTHLSYAPLVAMFALVATAAVTIRAVRDPGRRRHALRVAGGVALLVVVLWSQTAVEQFNGDDRGNISRLVDVAGAERGDSVGLRLGVDVAGELISPVPQWIPPSFETDFRPVPYRKAVPPRFEDGTSSLRARASIVATLAVLGTVVFWARRRGRTSLVTLGSVAVIASVGAVVSVVTLPLSFYGIPAHHVRWLWPVAITITTVLVAATLRSRGGIIAVAGATVVMSVLATVPTHPEIGPTADAYAGPVMRDLAPQLDDLRGRGPLVFDVEGTRVFEPYSVSVILELEQRGVDVTVEDAGLVRQFGPARAADGSESGRVFVWQAELAETGRPGAERVAFNAGLSPAEDLEHRRRTTEIAAWFDRGEFEVTDIGHVAIEDALIPDLEKVISLESEPFAAVGADSVWVAFHRGLLDSSAHEADVDRWSELHRRFVQETVGVWIKWSP